MKICGLRLSTVVVPLLLVPALYSAQVLRKDNVLLTKEGQARVDFLKAVADGAERGDSKTVLELLEKPAVDRRKALQHAIRHAAKAGSIRTIAEIINTSDDADLLNSATVEAITSEQTDLARLLIGKGGKPWPGWADGTTVDAANILAMLSREGATELIDLVLLAGADPNRMNEGGRYPLTAAATEGRVDAVRLLLNAGAEVNAVNEDGRTALSHAAEQGRREIVRILLAAGADTERQNGQRQTVLMEVASTSRAALLQTLLEWGANVDSRDAKGRTALMIAAEAGRIDNTRFLLFYKPDLDAKDEQGMTAVDYAAARRREDIIKALETARSRR